MDQESSARIMAAFRESGVRVLLDDFGAGHSSLARLLRLPLDGIKLDRGFLQAAPGMPGAAPWSPGRSKSPTNSG